MRDRFLDSFVDKLILLEQKTGASVSYRLMSPFEAPFHDYLSIQEAAKQIADFIGLAGFTFVVAVAMQKEKVGGHIDLSTGGKDIFIEIDENTMKFPNVVGAVLCHEVCHKWLQVNGISSRIEIESEILTDISTVFLGLGKIMLNGCRTTRLRYETIPNGTRTVAETMTSGYLDRDQLSFVYRLVCAMRNIPELEYMQDLSSEAVQSIQTCDASFDHYYDTRFHSSETIQESVDCFQKAIVELQREMAELDKNLTYISKACCETLDSFLSKGHKQLESLRQKTVAMTQKTESDPALNFLHTIQHKCELKRMNDKLESLEQNTYNLLEHARAIGRRLYRHSDRFPAPAPNMFNIVTCRQDGTKLRLPEQAGDLIASCPKCKYRFAYNTTLLSFTEVMFPRKRTWWEQIWNVIRRTGNG